MIGGFFFSMVAYPFGVYIGVPNTNGCDGQSCSILMHKDVRGMYYDWWVLLFLCGIPIWCLYVCSQY
jgi:hypothetical protein